MIPENMIRLVGSGSRRAGWILDFGTLRTLKDGFLVAIIPSRYVDHAMLTSEIRRPAKIRQLVSFPISTSRESTDAENALLSDVSFGAENTMRSKAPKSTSAGIENRNGTGRSRVASTYLPETSLLLPRRQVAIDFRSTSELLIFPA